MLYLLYFLDTQHVSGINMSIFRSLQLVGFLFFNYPYPKLSINEPWVSLHWKLQYSLYTLACILIFWSVPEILLSLPFRFFPLLSSPLSL